MVLEKVGTGCFAEVYRGRWNKREVAVKMMDICEERMKPGDKRSFRKCIEALMRVSHPNLANLAGFTLGKCPLQIISDYCAGGCLFELLHNADHIEVGWSQKAKVAFDVAIGVNFLHTTDPKIIHEDLKSLNLLLMQPLSSEADVPHVKVSDFGISQISAKEEYRGKPWQWGCSSCHHWTAPEVLRGATCNEESDVYSYAMVLFEVICREIPFEDHEPADVPRLVIQGARPDLEAVPPDCPQAFSGLMTMCWAQDPKQRPSFANVLEHLASLVNNVIVTLHLQHGGTKLACLSLSGELLGFDVRDVYNLTIGEIRSKVNCILSMQCPEHSIVYPRLLLTTGELVNSDCDKHTVAETFCLAIN